MQIRQKNIYGLCIEFCCHYESLSFDPLFSMGASPQTPELATLDCSIYPSIQKLHIKRYIVIINLHFIFPSSPVFVGANLPLPKTPLLATLV